MNKEYCFFAGGRVEFDDSKSVRELIQYVFNKLDYYEPLGMDIVTVFQCHHARTNNGWFTTDTGKSCSEEIENRNELCFAYYMPDVFYFAEGGWGHHMKELGNHPIIPNSVELNLRFKDFKNTVVVNGNYCFMDIIKLLKKADYVPKTCSKLTIIPVGAVNKQFVIPFTDEIMNKPLTAFSDLINEYTNKTLSDGEFVYHELIEIG